MEIRVPTKKQTNSLIGSLFNFSDDDVVTIKKYLLGGASLGAGAGLLASYMNYLNRLKRNEAEDDDDTLYVYKNASSVAPREDAYMATPVALAGGALSALASYALIKKIYTKLRLKAAQEDLDNAQHAFINASGYETADKPKLKNKPTSEESPVKVATFVPGRNITSTEALLSTPVLLPMLSALGAGIVAYKMLDKQFPAEIKKVKRPKRIEVIEKPDEDQEEYEKKASADSIEADGIEYLIRNTLLTKAATSDLSNLVAAVASGELDAFEKAAECMGFCEALDTVKGAAERDITPLEEHLAICTLAKKASINTQVAILAAAEFADTNTSAFASAAALDPDQQDCLYKASCCMGRAMRYELSSDLGLDAIPDKELTKTAATLDDVSDLSTGHLMGKMLQVMAKKKLMEDSDNESKDDEDAEDDANSGEVESGDFSTASDTSGEELGIDDPDSPSRRKKKDKVKFISNTKSRRGFLAKIDADVIDKILEP